MLSVKSLWWCYICDDVALDSEHATCNYEPKLCELRAYYYSDAGKCYSRVGRGYQFTVDGDVDYG